MKNLGYYNGKFGELEDMAIPMNDRVCYFGDGVYDATYSYNHKIYALDDHVGRFFESAALLDINLPLNEPELKALLSDMVKKVDDGEQFVYWQATRGTQIRGHAYEPGMEANIWIVLRPCPIKDVKQRIKVITVEDTRYLHCNIKTLNLIPNVMAAQKAEALGCQEAVFHREGRVTECAHSNVSILKDGVFIAPPFDNLILPGVTLRRIIKQCHRLGIPVRQQPFSLCDMLSADEMIISSAGQLALGVFEVDGRPAGGKAPDLLKNIQDALLEEFFIETL